MMPTMWLAIVSVVGFWVVAGAVSPPLKEAPCIEKEATDGARDGETRTERIARLELQLRLSKAERRSGGNR